MSAPLIRGFETQLSAAVAISKQAWHAASTARALALLVLHGECCVLALAHWKLLVDEGLPRTILHLPRGGKT